MTIGVGLPSGGGSHWNPSVQTAWNRSKALNRAKTELARRHRAELNQIKRDIFVTLQKQCNLPY